MIPPTDKVEDFKLKANMTVNELLSQMHKSGGFTAKKLGVAANILKEMINDKESTNFFSFPACINATGFYLKSWWGVIGVIPIFTATIGWCPAYLHFGISTGKRQ